MRVLINAATANMGGALNYITHLVKELSHRDSDDAFFVLAPPPTVALLHEILARAPHPQSIQLITSNQKGSSPLKSLWKNLREVSNLAKTHRCDVLFSSTGFGTWWSPCPEVLLVRNAAYFCPYYQKYSLQQGASSWSLFPRRWLSLMSIRSADTILFPSDSIQQEVQNYISLRKKKTRVLHYGFAHETFLKESTPPPILNEIERWKKEGYQILLHVSSYAIHKNIEVVLEALPEVRNSGIKLKWLTTLSREKTGDKELYDKFFERVKELGLSDCLVTSGHLQHKQLNALYRSADAFVFPSFTESFGQPLVEAMASSLPVIASDRPVHRELGQEAFEYFHTFDPKDCAQSLIKVLKNPKLQEDMSSRSSLRSKYFSWSKYTNSLLETLQAAAASQTNLPTEK